MRVLVCSDEIGALASGPAGRVIAEGWPRARTAVVPAGEAGAGFVAAIADRLGSPLVTASVDGRVVVRDRRVGSDRDRGAGRRPRPRTDPVRGQLARPGPRPAASACDGRRARILLDLASDDVHDGGAGLLARLGATADVPLVAGVAGLADLTRLDLEPARRALEGTELVGVVPAAERERPLLGLRGITSVRGRAAGEDAAPMLAADAALTRLADLAAPRAAATPGAGACGGVGLAVLALGGTLSTGPAVTLAGVDGPVDLVVTGCQVFDFATRGGGVVAAAAELAARLLCPCIVLAGEVLVGGREMRTMGIEAAYAVAESSHDAPTGGDVGAEQLRLLAERVARSWQW